MDYIRVCQRYRARTARAKAHTHRARYGAAYIAGGACEKREDRVIRPYRRRCLLVGLVLDINLVSMWAGA